MRHDFVTLGKSGLVVSRLALGTMTFGAEGWGASDQVSGELLDAYLNSGGNFIDTADVYSAGRAEEIVGDFIERRSLRDQIVLATKFTFNSGSGNPNAGGNGRKAMYRALDASLRRLKTDYIDLYWTHFWDMVTPVEEVLQSLGDLQRAGKIRYFAFSDVPAWYAAKAAAYATAHAIPGPIALQVEYSLAERSIEREHVPAALDAGLGIVPWGPLSSGFLTGKYKREEGAPVGDGRIGAKGHFRSFTESNWQTLDTLRAVAEELRKPMSQVALAWAVSQPGVSSLLMGVRSVEQLHDNLASADIRLSEKQSQRLNESSALEPIHPYLGFNKGVAAGIFGGKAVQGWT